MEEERSLLSGKRLSSNGGAALATPIHESSRYSLSIPSSHIETPCVNVRVSVMGDRALILVGEGEGGRTRSLAEGQSGGSGKAGVKEVVTASRKEVGRRVGCESLI